MKKLFTLLTVFLTASLLVACGDNGNGEDNGNGNDVDNGEDGVEISVVASVAGAEITIDPSDDITEGDSVTIETTVPNDYTFEHWLNTETDDVFGEDNPMTFTASEDLSLEAVFTEDVTSVRDDVLEQFDGDLSHMDDVMTALETSDAMEMTMNFSMEMANVEGMVPLNTDYQNSVDIELIQRVVEDDGLITETILTLSMPNLPDGEITFHTITKETDDFYEAYIDMGPWLALIDEEEDMDVKEIFNIDADMLHITMPSELRESLDELFMEAVKDGFDEEIDEALLDMILTELEALRDTYDLDYFMTLDPLIVEAEASGETDILTTVTVNHEVFTVIFEDLFEDIYGIMLMVDDEEMPPYETVIQTPEYEGLLEAIAALESFNIYLTHNPATANELDVSIDMDDLMPMIKDMLELDQLESMSMSMSMQDETVIDEVSDVVNVFRLVEEIYMISILDTALHSLQAVEDSGLDEGDYSLETLMHEHQIYFDIPAIDLSESTVSVTPDALTLTLIYSHNDEPVFHEPMTLEALEALNLDTPPDTRDDFLDMLAPINQAHLNIYQVMIEGITMLQEGMPVDPGYPGDIGGSLPEDDLVDYPDIESFGRYPNSMLVDAVDGDTQQLRVYATDDPVPDVYDDFLTFLQGHEMWNISDYGYDHIHNIGLIEVYTNEYYGSVKVDESDVYIEGGTSISIFVDLSPDDNGEDLQIPDDDLVNLEDLDSAPRFPDSILIEGADSDDFNLRRYVTTEDLVDIYEFYLAHYTDATTWVVIDDDIDFDDDTANVSATVPTSYESVLIDIVPSEAYVDAYEIIIIYTEN